MQHIAFSPEAFRHIVVNPVNPGGDGRLPLSSGVGIQCSHNVIHDRDDLLQRPGRGQPGAGIELVDQLPGTKEGFGFDEATEETVAPEATLPPSNP